MARGYTEEGDLDGHHLGLKTGEREMQVLIALLKEACSDRLPGIPSLSLSFFFFLKLYRLFFKTGLGGFFIWFCLFVCFKEITWLLMIM